jgi:ornithine carbamoyltransferase
MVAPVEEVPREDPDYDALVTRHFLTGAEITSDELDRILDRALELKADRYASRALDRRTVALVFEKPSTRTRVSMEVAVAQLGGTPLVLRESETQLSRGESLQDFALVLSRYVDAIAVRTAPHETLETLAAHASVPVINLLTAKFHPCQVLADLLTLRERFGSLDGVKLAYIGDGNNMANTLMLLGEIAGLEVAVSTPAQLQPDTELAASLNGAVTLTADPAEAAAGAHALYTDVWVSMGDDEATADERRALLDPYRLDDALMARARDDAIALHCLPAHPGEEITADLLYGPRSAVWDQAENRLHAQKALLEFLIPAAG